MENVDRKSDFYELIENVTFLEDFKACSVHFMGFYEVITLVCVGCS